MLGNDTSITLKLKFEAKEDEDAIESEVEEIYTIKKQSSTEARHERRSSQVIGSRNAVNEAR